MTKPLPVIFAVLPVAAWRTIRVACRYNRRRSIYVYMWLDMSGTSAWPAV